MLAMERDRQAWQLVTSKAFRPHSDRNHIASHTNRPTVKCLQLEFTAHPLQLIESYPIRSGYLLIAGGEVIFNVNVPFNP